MSEGDRVHRFLRGLRPTIATPLRIQGVSTLDTAIAMAARVGSLADFGSASQPNYAGPAPASAASPSGDYMELDGIEGLEKGTTVGDGISSSASTPVTQQQLAAYLNAMRHDRSSNRTKELKTGGKDVSAAIAKRFRLSAEQVREYRDKGQCFNLPGWHRSLLESLPSAGEEKLDSPAWRKPRTRRQFHVSNGHPLDANPTSIATIASPLPSPSPSHPPPRPLASRPDPATADRPPHGADTASARQARPT